MQVICRSVKAIEVKAKKLTKADTIRHVWHSDWLTNKELVKKANGKWCMCMDFTILNKECPKDNYPLPCIDQLVDSTAECELQSFMDAYSSYHQVHMAKDDELKTSFATPKGTHCYLCMPSSQRNARATFQCLMNLVLHGQVRRNVEVYVDDVVVKSPSPLHTPKTLKKPSTTFVNMEPSSTQRSVPLESEARSF